MRKSVRKWFWAGVEYLGSIFRWAYFRKKTDGGEFNLFFDNSSRLKHLNRILLLLGIVGITEAIIGTANIWTYFSEGTATNLALGIFCLLLGLLIGYGYLRVYSEKRKIKKSFNCLNNVCNILLMII